MPLPRALMDLKSVYLFMLMLCFWFLYRWERTSLGPLTRVWPGILISNPLKGIGRSSRLGTLGRGPGSSSHTSTGQSHIYLPLDMRIPAPKPPSSPQDQTQQRWGLGNRRHHLYLLLCLCFISLFTYYTLTVHLCFYL